MSRSRKRSVSTCFFSFDAAQGTEPQKPEELDKLAAFFLEAKRILKEVLVVKINTAVNQEFKGNTTHEFKAAWDDYYGSRKYEAEYPAKIPDGDLVDLLKKETSEFDIEKLKEIQAFVTAANHVIDHINKIWLTSQDIDARKIIKEKFIKDINTAVTETFKTNNFFKSSWESYFYGHKYAENYPADISAAHLVSLKGSGFDEKKLEEIQVLIKIANHAIGYIRTLQSKLEQLPNNNTHPPTAYHR